jgi:hypothetical protein
MTKGEYKVGINFNPSQEDVVGRIKRLAADFIDLVDAIEVKGSAEDSDEDYPEKSWTQVHEVLRLKAIAMSEIESASMWAVKAATKGLPE